MISLPFLCADLVAFPAVAKFTNGVVSKDFFTESGVILELKWRGHESNPILDLSRSVLVVLADLNSSIVTRVRIEATVEQLLLLDATFATISSTSLLAVSPSKKRQSLTPPQFLLRTQIV